MEEANLNVLTDTKKEYSRQLINILKPLLYSGIQRIYKEAKDDCPTSDDKNSTLSTFQDYLSRVPQWSQSIIDDEYENIVNRSQCDYLDNLITAVFLSYTRILTVINTGKTNKKIPLKIPKPGHFIHKCYIDIAREFWKLPMIFDDQLPPYEKQKNMREAELIISESIEETIRKQLPVKHILLEYLGNDYDQESEENENITETLSGSYQDYLRRLVKKEIANYSVGKEVTESDIRHELDLELDNKNLENEDKDKIIQQVMEELNNEEKPEAKLDTKVEELMTKEFVKPNVEELNVEELNVEKSVKPKVEDASSVDLDLDQEIANLNMDITEKDPLEELVTASPTPLSPMPSSPNLDLDSMDLDEMMGLNEPRKEYFEDLAENTVEEDNDPFQIIESSPKTMTKNLDTELFEPVPDIDYGQLEGLDSSPGTPMPSLDQPTEFLVTPTPPSTPVNFEPHEPKKEEVESDVKSVIIENSKTNKKSSPKTSPEVAVSKTSEPFVIERQTPNDLELDLTDIGEEINIYEDYRPSLAPTPVSHETTNQSKEYKLFPDLADNSVEEIEL